ncbi:MAG: Hpt domain-containing protein [Actinomycetes bacterium]
MGATTFRPGVPAPVIGLDEARKDSHMGRAPYRLPDTLAASLERAFAGEVAERLPRLLAATDKLTETTEAAGQVMSDAHALASSAAVVGADMAAHAARECEALLAPYAGTRAVPFAVAQQATVAAEQMRDALAAWATWAQNRTRAESA